MLAVIQDWAELRELLETDAGLAEVCEWIANVDWEDMDKALAYAKPYGITENDVMLWIYLNLK